MCRAILISKAPYSGQYGSGIEFTFKSDDIGEYKSKKKDADLNGERYGFLRDLPIGSVVDLKKNDKGAGYFINQVKEQPETTEDIFNSMGKPEQSGNKVEKMADLLSECEKAMKSRLDTNFYSPEQVKCFAVSLFIQVAR